jgi:hypothetical protein
VIQIELIKAIGIPLPDKATVKRTDIVGREIRITLFEETKEVFMSNCLNLECKYNEGYEDRLYFDTHGTKREEYVYIKVPEDMLLEKTSKVFAIFEIVNFIRKGFTKDSIAMSAGFAKLNLSELLEGKTMELEVIGGNPGKDKIKTIRPEDIRKHRSGFVPTVLSIFEGAITPKLKIGVSFLTRRDYGPVFENLEIMPEVGVFHAPQLDLLAYYRQCTGQDAFSQSKPMRGVVNTNLVNEMYSNTFSSLMNIPRVATVICHFWQSNVLAVFGKETYEARMNALKKLFIRLYPVLTSPNFHFDRQHQTNQRYAHPQENHSIMNERMSLLKSALEDFWSGYQLELAKSKDQKFVKMDTQPLIQNLAELNSEVSLKPFSIDELIEDDNFGL